MERGIGDRQTHHRVPIPANRSKNPGELTFYSGYVDRGSFHQILQDAHLLILRSRGSLRVDPSHGFTGRLYQ